MGVGEGKCLYERVGWVCGNVGGKGGWVYGRIGECVGGIWACARVEERVGGYVGVWKGMWACGKVCGRVVGYVGVWEGM